MKALKKIALVTCASNFERLGNIVRAMRRRISEMEGYVLYVISSYGVFHEDMSSSQGEASIYHLLERIDLDGCILEANLGSRELVDSIIRILKRRGIPALGINLMTPEIPCLHLEIKTAGVELFEHLIREHHCSRINLVLSDGNRAISENMLEVYTRELSKHGLSFDERRVISTSVSFRSGRDLYISFDRRGVMKDAEAVVCIHDVCAIGLYMELHDRGIRVPEDCRICSVNCSGNSIAWFPMITGIDRMDGKAAELACELMDRVLRGEEISMDNRYPGQVRCLSSCGCPVDITAVAGRGDVFQRLVVNKVEAANQIGRMMRFNAALEDVDTVSQLASNLHQMMLGIGCRFYYCCLNEEELSYISSNREITRKAKDAPFQDRMVVLSGEDRTRGEMTRVSFALEEFIPAVPQEGDVFLALPIHYRNRSYGYMVFLNDMLPVDNYYFRICQDSIGSNIENLHQKLILKSNIEELDRLHMQDQMTGLKNRFALKRYRDDYVQSPNGYSIAVIDLDGLKTINDHFGHLAGNNAIIIAADAIRDAVRDTDLVIRYGGDEFLILSHETDAAFWEERRETIRKRLNSVAAQQQLPYHLGVSLGYAVSRQDDPLPIEKSLELADNAMYEEKKRNHAAMNLKAAPVKE